MSDFSPPRLAPGGYIWLEGQPPITEESSQRLFLDAETFMREHWHWGEQIRCTGLYVGPRELWARFASPDERRLTATVPRKDFDRWREEVGA